MVLANLVVLSYKKKRVIFFPPGPHFPRPSINVEDVDEMDDENNFVDD